MDLRASRLAIRLQVQKFRDWASTYASRHGEWECDYPDWAPLYEAVHELVDRTPVEEWDEATRHDVLYALARDNEAELIADHIAEQEERLIDVSRLALSMGEKDAKWQLANRLGGISRNKADAELLLLQLVTDGQEYVRRRALLALAELGSAETERLSVVAWGTGLEYQRMAALEALRVVDSARFNEFIELAKADGRQYLVAAAHRLSERD